MFDVVNAIFECGGAVILWMNVHRLYQDKKVSGVSIAPFVFYAAWGIWNPFYYQNLGQTLSAIAGIGVLLANLAWLALFFWYKFNPPECEES
jgi:hypothetical protein